MHHLSIDLARAQDAERLSRRLPADLRLGGLREWARAEHQAATAAPLPAPRRRAVAQQN